jgi:BAI1-associated protein 3
VEWEIQIVSKNFSLWDYFIANFMPHSDVDDINSDQLHLDIWDHDDESSVLDAVSRLNEVRGVRGLGRFFKQVCQSARQGSQDDFLGSINIPISVIIKICWIWISNNPSFMQEIPSTGIEGWFKLEGRSHRSSVQGRIRLKLWLSTRDDHGQSEDDILVEIRKLERCYVVFMQHELLTHEPTWSWSGDIQGSALTILHQMAVQADLSELQCAMARFVAAISLNNRTPLDPKFIHRIMLVIRIK